MTPSLASAGPEAAARLAQTRRAAAPSAGGLGPGLSGSDSPETPKEAAEQFEKVLVRQFVDVMTEGMYDASLAGDDGNHWMGSQRDRQRRVMTDMITDKLTEAGDLQISKTLLRSWGVEASSEAPTTEAEDEAPAPPSPETSVPDMVDPLPAPADSPSSQNRPQIDHVV